ARRQPALVETGPAVEQDIANLQAGARERFVEASAEVAGGFPPAAGGRIVGLGPLPALRNIPDAGVKTEMRAIQFPKHEIHDTTQGVEVRSWAGHRQILLTNCFPVPAGPAEIFVIVMVTHRAPAQIEYGRETVGRVYRLKRLESIARTVAGSSGSGRHLAAGTTAETWPRAGCGRRRCWDGGPCRGAAG